MPSSAHVAGVSRDEPGDRVQRRRLAGAVRPDQADDLALLDAQADIAHGGDGAVADLEAGELECRVSHRSPPARRGRRRPRRGCARISSGVPSASVWPWSSTWIRSQTSMTSAMLWSISSTPAVVVVAHRAHHGGELGHLGLGQPGRRLVHEHERAALSRARGRRRAAARRREPACRPGVLGQPREAQQLEQIVGATAGLPRRLRRRRVLRPRRSPAPVSSRNERLCWNVRASPARARRCALQPVTRRPASSTLPAVGKSKPESTLTSVDLPAPFGPIRPDDLVPVQLERDVGERADALERPRDGGGPKSVLRASSPPLRRSSLAPSPRSSGRPWR